MYLHLFAGLPEGIQASGGLAVVDTGDDLGCDCLLLLVKVGDFSLCDAYDFQLVKARKTASRPTS